MRRTLPRLERELVHWPGVTFTLDLDHRHPRLVLAYNGRSRFYCFSRTPTTAYGLKNAVAGLRRTLRELGATRDQH